MFKLSSAEFYYIIVSGDRCYDVTQVYFSREWKTILDWPFHLNQNLEHRPSMTKTGSKLLYNTNMQQGRKYVSHMVKSSLDSPHGGKVLGRSTSVNSIYIGILSNPVMFNITDFYSSKGRIA
jgi:hypothetical protein